MIFHQIRMQLFLLLLISEMIVHCLGGYGTFGLSNNNAAGSHSLGMVAICWLWLTRFLSMADNY